MRTPRVTVRQGACRLNDLWLVHRGPGFIHFRGDMRAKYAAVFMFSETSFFVEATRRTLHKEPKRAWETTHGMTEVKIHAPGGRRWTVHARISRYTLDVFCYTAAKHGRCVYSAEEP